MVESAGGFSAYSLSSYLFPPLISHRSLTHPRGNSSSVSPPLTRLSILSLSQSFPVTLSVLPIPSLCLSLASCSVYLFEH